MRKILLIAFSVSFVISTNAQLSIGNTNTDYTINFDSTVSGVNNGSYDGTGFATTPATGDLDGNAWAVTGFGNNQGFDGTATTDDMARGTHAGGAGSGGLYSFQVGGASDVAFGIQPGSSDFTPGTVTLKITNNTGSTVTRFEIDYEVWEYNDQNRSNSLNFSYSSNGSDYTTVASVDYTTTLTAAGSPSWSSTAKNATVYGLSIADGANFYIRWTGDDVSGSEGRDEYAIDDIVLKVNAPISTTQDGDWDLGNTWASGSVPASTDDVIIAHNNDVDDVRSCNSLTVNSGARLDVEANLTVATTSANNGTLYVKTGDLTQSAGNFTNAGTLRVYGGYDLVFSSSSTTLTNTGTITIYSSASAFGSILLSGTYSESGSGTIQYSRYIAGTDYWDLIGPPLSGYSVEDFVFDNNDIATNGSSPTTYAVGYYVNTASASSTNGGWTNYNSDTYGTNLLSGKGYQMSTVGASTGAEVTFEGTLLTSNVTRTVTTNEAGNVSNSDGTKFELIANPYASYISTTEFINAHKDTQLHSGHAAVYGWDGTGYDTYNIAAPGNNIAPGQGFFIGVRGSAGTNQTITFTTAMQNTTGSGDYNEYDTMDNSAELFIQLSQNNSDKRTRIFFLPEGTDGLDVGYDAAGLDLGAYSIYTRLISDDEGLNMDIQTLNFDNMLGKVIPLGVNIEAGSEAEISILNSTINTDYYVYLEDSLTGAFIDLTEENYVINSDSNIEGVGRFFIHMTADTMSNGEVSTSMLNAYKEIDASYITIEGLATQSNETKVSLYNILGREVLATTLNNNMGTQTISTVGLSAGIYVIQLESGSDRLTKKLIIQ